jgi:hypothetical protein
MAPEGEGEHLLHDDAGIGPDLEGDGEALDGERARPGRRGHGKQ